MGKVIRICYAWSASNAGVSFPLLEHPDRSIPHLRGKVIPAIRKYLASIDSKIHLDNTMIRPKLRQHDKCIMDFALSYTARKAQLERINAIREYLNIQYLSEICNPDGSQLATGILYGNQAEKQYFRRQKGPKQNKPNTRSWTIWSKFLDTLLCSNLTLRQPLGP